MNLTDRQIKYRQYLQSKVWEDKRQEALSHYGCICSRCGKWGNDVHHKTYKRVGGFELLSDLEVLCRECHEAHHRVEFATRPKPKCKRNRSINRQALATYLTESQKTILKKRYELSAGGLYSAITQGTNDRLINDALKMLGKKRAYSSKKHYSCIGSHALRFNEVHHNKLMA